MKTLCLYLLLLMPLSAGAFCFKEAGQRYKVDPLLLQAIGIQESGLRQGATNKNYDRQGKLLSTDYGVMQINTINANRLVRMGLINQPEDLLRNACFNVQAGAWVLAQHLRVCGNTWRCLGSYNAGFKSTAGQEAKRLRYAQRVRVLYDRLKTQSPPPANLAIR
ncbi:lytic transglycosylase domain-containing protein [Pseudomonas syringae]|uniref:lytic transglycosylase domain-containing protein n=1 Tax=Pseudomonas ovata TaxID=1839709 RepID=UPI00137A31CD|nr:lytic transglycosylase domain-containing protein [Pseudomonas ovata]MBD8792712.1 lytic transglycosylase domain-containing protein [Pseudomonas syringae]MBD8803158.1 lytic transglycosylase domain-containing protein [Pseudomonas syringae]MBD8813978.1 lytic transglycosylase domain-containing protein [Pseudomonas syringae]